MDTGGQLSNKTPALLQFAVMVCIVVEAYCVLYLAENNSLCVGCTVPFLFHHSEVSFPVLVIESHWMFRQVHIAFWRRHTKQNFELYVCVCFTHRQADSVLHYLRMNIPDVRAYLKVSLPVYTNF